MINHLMIFVLLIFLVAAGSVSAQSAYTDVTPDDALKMMLENPELVIIDVSPMYTNGHLPNSVNHPVGDGSLDKGIPMLNKEATYLVYCHSDGPSISGAQKLVDAGFKNVYRLVGNYSAWVDAGYPVSQLMPYVEVSPQQALKMMLENPELVIIDVSPVYTNGHLPNSVNHPVGDGSLDKGIPTLKAHLTYLVYCHGDTPSIAGSQKLVDAGFKNVYRLVGNYSAWVDAGYPVEK